MTDQPSLEEIKKQCVFCHIISGRVASKKVFEDDKVTAVLDINPGNPGHILLLPKEHYAIMPQIPDEVIGHMGMIAKALSSALLRALKTEGSTVFIANGVVAGQRAQHFMLHVIPRIEGDNLGIELPERSLSDDKLTEIKNALLPGIKRALGSVVESEQKSAAKKESPKKETGKKDDLDEIARLLGA